MDEFREENSWKDIRFWFISLLIIGVQVCAMVSSFG
jgi:hypothetical protein